MSNELKPCPHCGAAGERIILQEHPARTPSPSFKAEGQPDYPGIWTIQCPTEGCAAMIDDTREAVVAAWNRRPAPDELKPQASVDTPEFRQLIHRYLNCGANYSDLIAHIDAWGARLAEDHMFNWLNGEPNKVAAAATPKEDACGS
jgi:hypothetical protein